MGEWIKKIITSFTDGLMKHLGTAIGVFIVSGGYLIALSKLQEFQTWVREIPTDYVLTPFVLVAVFAFALIRINHKQRQDLQKIVEQPKLDNKESRMVTHYGVWWKLYPESDYMEDFPYCPCCSPPRKLVQIEWHPEEKFKCPSTGTEVQLFDGIPWELEKVRSRIYDAYFGGQGIEEPFLKEFRRLKELNPEKAEKELLADIFKISPFNRLPAAERNSLLQRFDRPHDLIFFVKKNMHFYRPLLRQSEKSR